MLVMQLEELKIGHQENLKISPVAIECLLQISESVSLYSYFICFNDALNTILAPAVLALGVLLKHPVAQGMN